MRLKQLYGDCDDEDADCDDNDNNDDADDEGDDGELHCDERYYCTPAVAHALHSLMPLVARIGWG